MDSFLWKEILHNHVDFSKCNLSLAIYRILYKCYCSSLTSDCCWTSPSRWGSLTGTTTTLSSRRFTLTGFGLDENWGSSTWRLVIGVYDVYKGDLLEVAGVPVVNVSLWVVGEHGWQELQLEEEEKVYLWRSSCFAAQKNRYISSWRVRQRPGSCRVPPGRAGDTGTRIWKRVEGEVRNRGNTIKQMEEQAGL